MSFIDQFVVPLNIAQGLYLYGIGESLKKEQNTSNLELPEGSILIINNYYWLHGRDQFIAHKNLHRELLRKRAAFLKILVIMINNFFLKYFVNEDRKIV